MIDAYCPGPIPWPRLSGPLAGAEDALARLDERIRASPIAEGFICRNHFRDACDSVWLAGELVNIEDLVLHDARMDVRSPTHELTRAQAVLRARRLIVGAEPEWALSEKGLKSLRLIDDDENKETERAGEGEILGQAKRQTPEDPIDDPLAEQLAAFDRALERSTKLLAGAATQMTLRRDAMIYDPHWGDEEKLESWRSAAAASLSDPPLLAAAQLWDVWERNPPLERQAWLGNLLIAAILRSRGKTRSHLLCLNAALRLVTREKRRSPSRPARLAAFLEAIIAGADAGMKDHDRWLLARRSLEGKLKGRRSSSKLPAFVDYILSRPIASAGMIANALGVTPRAAQDMVAELGLREFTGRGRYRAWGIL